MNKNVRNLTFLSSLAVINSLIISSAFALVPYEKKAFTDAKSSGKTIALEFFAPWCPTCRAQDKALEALSNQPAFQNVVFLKADYDEETELKKELSVIAQSTLIVFKGTKEINRSRGQTESDDLAVQIKEGLATDAMMKK